MSRRKLYTLEAIDKLIEHYQARPGALVTEHRPGVLGHGTLVLTAPGLKVAIVQEHYLNEWSSAHSIRFYNRLPAKYWTAKEAV